MRYRFQSVCCLIAILFGLFSPGSVIASQSNPADHRYVEAVSPIPGGPNSRKSTETSSQIDETWTLADSPIVISGTHTILTGVTVTIEPGVVIELQQGALLLVEGTLLGLGTSVMPITFEGSVVYPTRVRVPGSIELSNAIVSIVIEPSGSSSAQFTDTIFSNPTLPAGIVQPSGGRILSFDGCTFDGNYLWVWGTTVKIKDTNFINNFVSIEYSYAYLDNVSVTNTSQWSLRFVGFEQPLFVDNVSATNAAGGGLEMVAGNYFIGPNVQLQGNVYPVKLAGSGILPGSTLPISGNLNNYINVESESNGAWHSVWADTGIPYAMTGGQYHAGALDILPGVTVLLEPNFTVWGDDDRVDARGLPGAPVRFEQLVPGQTWQGLQYFHRFENCIIDGGQVGARFSSWTTGGYIDNCIIRNNDHGMQNSAIVRKTIFSNNIIGAWGAEVSGSLESATNPNSFVGNGLAVDYVDHMIDARFSWWGDPSGPTTPNNPGGTGDPVDVGVGVVPFLTAEPNFNDNPPIVHLLKGPRPENVGGAYSSFVDPGSTVIISWDSQDDTAVTAHRVEFYNSWEFTWTVVAELPGWQRSFEWLVPDIGPTNNSSVPKLRVTAIDSAGQEGWDEHMVLIPTGDEPGTLTVTMNPNGGPFLIEDMIGPLCVDAVGTDPYDAIVAEISFDGDQRHIPLGSAFIDGCLGGAGSSGPSAPFISTDTARFRVNTNGGQNRVKYFFSDYFTIRPDPRLGDPPPAVTMTSPNGGESFPGGGIVPIRFTATDDEGVRAVDIQVSTDGGRTWLFIAEDLPSASTGFDWQLPPSSGLTDVRVRVMVSDMRFQTSSAGGNVIFNITAGTGSGDFIFNDNFELGDMSRWSSAVQ